MSTMGTDIVYAKGLLGKAKTIVAAASPVVVAIEAAITDNEITSNEWVAIGTAAIFALGVYFTPNKGANVPAAAPVDLGPLDEGYTSTPVVD